MIRGRHARYLLQLITIWRCHSPSTLGDVVCAGDAPLEDYELTKPVVGAPLDKRFSVIVS
jgi:hypothetical protein